MEVKILKPFLNHKAGDVVNVETDEAGTPKTIYWRKRFKDAEHDNCLEKIENKKIKSKGEK